MDLWLNSDLDDDFHETEDLQTRPRKTTTA